MTIATGRTRHQKPLSFDKFLALYGSDRRAEVVSSNWRNDYARKVEDYATLGILKYWIADYAGLGETRHIGKPKQPTLSICRLVDGESEIQQFRGNQAIASPTFPGLKLTAEQVLRSGA